MKNDKEKKGNNVGIRLISGHHPVQSPFPHKVTQFSGPLSTTYYLPKTLKCGAKQDKSIHRLPVSWVERTDNQAATNKQIWQIQIMIMYNKNSVIVTLSSGPNIWKERQRGMS